MNRRPLQPRKELRWCCICRLSFLCNPSAPWKRRDPPAPNALHLWVSRVWDRPHTEMRPDPGYTTSSFFVNKTSTGKHAARGNSVINVRREWRTGCAMCRGRSCCVRCITAPNQIHKSTVFTLICAGPGGPAAQRAAAVPAAAPQVGRRKEPAAQA